MTFPKYAVIKPRRENETPVEFIEKNRDAVEWFLKNGENLRGEYLKFRQEAALGRMLKPKLGKVK